MTGSGSRVVALTGGRVDALARQFLESDYAGDQYLNWSLDRRLEGFLRHNDLGHVADNGDLFNLVLDRTMARVHQWVSATWRPSRRPAARSASRTRPAL